MTNFPKILRRSALASLLAVAGIASQAAMIEINGDVTQTADLKNSPVTGLAIGPAARAHAAVNAVEGSVKLSGSLKQSATLNNSPVTALAIGPAAEATARVNAISGK